MAIRFLTSQNIQAGTLTVSTIANLATASNTFLVSDGGLVKYRTAAQVRSDIGAGTGSGTVTSVAVTNGTGISASVANATTTPNITITNTDRGSSQAIFKNFAVSGQSTVVADTNNDTLTLVAGSNVTITTNATTDTITIASSYVDSNNYPTSLSWATATGILTLGRNGLSSLTVDLDGRYAELGTQTINKVTKWNGSNVITQSNIFDNGTNVGINNTNTSFNFDVTGTSRFSQNVQLDNTADLTFVDVAGTYPTSGKGFDWTLNNDGARIYAVQPSSDSIDLVFMLRDNATLNDRFVFFVDDYLGPATDKYPLIIRGGTEFDLVSSSLFVNGVIRLSNTGILQNVTGNISMFTNDSGYITSSALSGYVPTSRTLTINGTTQNLSANRTFNVGTVTGVTGTAPIVSSGGTAPAISITAATTGAAGSMSAADKSKLDGIASGAQVNVATNLGYTTATTTGTVTSSTGTNATLPAATTALAGLMTNADKTKLDGIASGAQVNVATNLSKTTSTTDVTINSSTGTNVAIGAASTSVAGVMTKALYDNVIANNAKVSNVTTNLGYTASTTNGVVTSSDGTNATLPLVVAAGNAGLMTGVDKTKLDGIAAGAQSGTVTSVSGTGSVSGLTLTGTVTTSGSLTLGGTLSLTAANVNAVGAITNSTSGNAGSATVLQNVRLINNVGFNGSGNISVDPYVEDAVTTSVTRYLTFVDNSTAGYKRLNEDANLTYNPGTNVLTVPTVSAALSGNATTAATLQTARTINGTSFNGSANIVTSYWGTTRTLTIGNTGKSVNGSANVAWSLAEIGAQAALTNPVTGTGANNRVALWNGTTTLTSDADLVFDGANLGVGTASPTAIGGSITTLDIKGTNGGGIRSGISEGSESTFYTIGAGAYLGTISSIPLYFQTNNSVKATITANGSFGVGTTNPSSRFTSETSASGPTSYTNLAAIFGNNISTDTTYNNQVGVAGRVITSGGKAIYGDAATNSGWAGWFDGKGYFSGNVGIATSSPSYPLDVNGIAVLRSALYMTAGGGSSVPNWSFQINGSGDLVVDEAISTQNFIFSNSGQVLIGTTVGGTPAYGSAPQFVTASATGGVIDIRSLNTNIVANSLLGRIQFTGKDDNTVGYTSAAIEAVSAGTTASGSNGGGILKFMTSTTGYGTNPLPRMWISHSGYVTIGSTNTNSYPLRVTTQVSNISIYADYDIVAFSDQSVKENIRPIENVIERVQKSRGVLYDRIDSGSKDNIGFIAQELEVAFPELVITNEDGTKAVKYQNAVAVMFEAIKEQQKQIDELKELVTKLIK